MVTSCYRRLGNLKKALQMYKDIHKQYPDNIECLRYLVALCKDLGENSDVYAAQYAQLERQNKNAGATTFAPTRVQQNSPPPERRQPPPRVAAPIPEVRPSAAPVDGNNRAPRRGSDRNFRGSDDDSYDDIDVGELLPD